MHNNVNNVVFIITTEPNGPRQMLIWTELLNPDYWSLNFTQCYQFVSHVLYISINIALMLSYS